MILVLYLMATRRAIREFCASFQYTEVAAEFTSRHYLDHTSNNEF